VGTGHRSQTLKRQAAWRQADAASTGEQAPRGAPKEYPGSPGSHRGELQKGKRAERPGCAGRGEGLKREKGKSGSGRLRVEYPEVRLRIAGAAQIPEADQRLWRELAHVAKDSAGRQTAKV